MHDDQARTADAALRAYFDNMAPNYAAKRQGETLDAFFFNCRVRGVLELLRDCHAGSVLDVGCGPGVMADALLEQRFRYSGIDISDGMIAECCAKYADRPGAEFAVADAQSLPFNEESFDVVLCLGALEYMPNVDQAMHEMVRVLTRDGTLVFSMLNGNSPCRRLERLCRKVTRFCRHFTEGFADELLARHGLRKVDCLYYDFSLLPLFLAQRHPQVFRLLSTRLEFLCRGSLRVLGSAFLVKARRN